MSGPVLRVLSELGEGHEKSLLIELPKALAEEINIRHDGSVDAMSLLKLLRKAAVSELKAPVSSAVGSASDCQSQKELDEEAVERKAFLMNMIFNKDLAFKERA